MRAALLGEGPSDRVLLPVLRWVLERATPAEAIVEWADTGQLARARSLEQKVRALRSLLRVDILFVHRDADNQRPELRYREIAEAAKGAPFVAVVPVRTTETWLLCDAGAIRAAAGRPSGREPLPLPRVARLEEVANPKLLLRDLLVEASATAGRKRERFDPVLARSRVADLVEDWSVLRSLAGFRHLESDTRVALATIGVRLNPSG